MTVLVLLLACLLFAFVLQPLLVRAEEPAPVPEPARGAAVLEERRRSAYDAILDLDFEHATGKLSDGDWQAVRAELVAQAAAVLAELGAIAPGEKLDRWIEDETRRRLQEGGRPCPGCGQAVPAGGRYCDRCGQALASAGCARCGAANRAGARFCASCGAGL